MEITALIHILRRWSWLIILVAIVTGSVSFTVWRTKRQSYLATATLQVGGYVDVSNPTQSDIGTSALLAQTYAQIVKTYPVLSAVIKKLNLPISTDELASSFRTALVPNTALMTISVTYQDPITAADIANELAVYLIASSPTQLSDVQKRQLATLQDEMGKASAQLQSTRDELKVIDDSLTQGVSGQDQAILTARKAELTNEINAAQSNLTAMSGQVLELQRQNAVNQLRVVEDARVPDQPISQSPFTAAGTAAAVGAVLAAGAAFLIEYLNDSIRSPAEIMSLLNLPVIGTIAPFGRKNTYKNKLITWTQPRSNIAEAYRALRVNLLYREAHSDEGQHDCRIYLVTSSGPSEGKSVTVANLAVTFAITGMRVLVIDTDLRRPSMHQIFELPNTQGMSNIWAKANVAKSETFTRGTSVFDDSNNGSKDSLIRRSMLLYLSHLAQKTAIPGLEIVTSGPVLSNPGELLDTVQMRELVAQIVSSKRYDAVFFDTPPTLVVSDSGVLASVTKGQMIVVVESGRTRRGSAVRTIQQLASLSVNVAGVVVNRMNRRDLDAGYGEYYYGYSYKYYGESGVKRTPADLKMPQMDQVDQPQLADTEVPNIQPD